MTWSHDREVPVIDRCDFGQPEALGDGNNRRVDEAQRKIQLSVYQFGACFAPPRSPRTRRGMCGCLPQAD
jgi:hypothetical protein